LVILFKTQYRKVFTGENVRNSEQISPNFELKKFWKRIRDHPFQHSTIRYIEGKNLCILFETLSWAPRQSVTVYMGIIAFCTLK
jgi:hypothetical protein